MRCPACNARNPETAAWCSQCYTPLRSPEPPPPPEPSRRDPDAAAAPAAPGRPPSTARSLDGSVEVREPAGGAEQPVQVVQRGHATFRKTSQGLDWRCGLCESFNPIEVQRCTACGHSFSDTVRGPQQVTVPDVSENAALLASAVLPGAGHYLAGRTATAVARALMYMLFVLGGWMLLREAGASNQSVLPATPLLLGALVIWGTSAFDAVLAARGEERQLLQGRVFFWLVVGVLGLLMATFAAAALSVSAG